MVDGMSEQAVVIDIEACLTAMNRRRLQDENQRPLTGTNNSNSDICMYKVPHSLTEISPKTPNAIDPEKVSIGPYHRGKNQLLEFESYKWRFLNNLLTRTKKDLKVFIQAAKSLEERARRCYDDTVIMSSPDFVEMMVLDGCFIIELFRHGGTNDASIFSWPEGLIPVITGDLLKLENQLPFFVLQELFVLSLNQRKEGGDERKKSEEMKALPLLALKFFHGAFPSPNEEVLNRSSSEFSDVKHLLHLFHSSCCRTAAERIREPVTIFQIFMREAWRLLKKKMREAWRRPIVPWRGPINLILKFLLEYSYFVMAVYTFIFACAGILLGIVLRVLFLIMKWFLDPYGSQKQYRPSSDSIQCATKLRNSGVTFKPLRAESLLLIRYEDLVLHMCIPVITISELTVTVFVNCIALEQCSYQNTASSYFTTYIAFMGCLINSSKDVALLSKHGIITSSFPYNDHEVATLFNKLGEKVYFHERGCYLSQQFKDIQYYYNGPWAKLIRRYFSHPWSFISFFSAFILLSLSVGQTVLSILTYKHNLNIWSASGN